MIKCEYLMGELKVRFRDDHLAVILTDDKDVRLELSHGAAHELAIQLSIASDYVRENVREAIKKDKKRKN